MERQRLSDRFITLSNAALTLGVSRATMSRLAKEGQIAVYSRQIDKRFRYVRASDVYDLMVFKSDSTSERVFDRRMLERLYSLLETQSFVPQPSP